MVMVEHHGVRAKQDTVSDGRFSKHGYAGSAIHEQIVPDAKGTTLNNAYVCTGLNDNIVTNLHMAAFPQSKPQRSLGDGRRPSSSLFPYLNKRILLIIEQAMRFTLIETRPAQSQSNRGRGREGSKARANRVS